MPKTGKLPHEWYETSNIHLTTIIDFREFCRKAGIHVLQEIPLRTSGPGRRSVVRAFPQPARRLRHFRSGSRPGDDR